MSINIKSRILIPLLVVCLCLAVVFGAFDVGKAIRVKNVPVRGAYFTKLNETKGLVSICSLGGGCDFSLISTSPATKLLALNVPAGVYLIRGIANLVNFGEKRNALCGISATGVNISFSHEGYSPAAALLGAPDSGFDTQNLVMEATLRVNSGQASVRLGCGISQNIYEVVYLVANAATLSVTRLDSLSIK